MEIDGKTALVSWEMKPGIIRQGLVFLGPNFSNQNRGLTNDRDVFRLAITFGLEVYHKRFKVGQAREQPDPDEVRELGDRLEKFALPDAPPWQELTDF